MTEPLKGAAAKAAEAVGWRPPADYRWTEGCVAHPLRSANVGGLVEKVNDYLTEHHIIYPKRDALVQRCIQALLVGHLVLKGPPGTGKTTLARALAIAFDVEIIESTATSEWTPFHIIGGFRPNSKGGLEASNGKITESVIACASRVQVAEQDPDNTELRQGTWLLIDEFNRADIDKALGPLFTVLSSCDTQHLRATPIDLWYEPQEIARRLWVPARFRLIACMNDLDTAFVNQISQGLTRRFQFVTIGAQTAKATASEPVTIEVQNATLTAHEWLQGTYGAAFPDFPDASTVHQALEPYLVRLQRVIDGLRHPAGVPGWPVGTAQIVDVMRAVMIAYASDPDEDLWNAVDNPVADRIVPQMSSIDDAQEKVFTALFAEHGLHSSAGELAHIMNPHEML